jgi:hypothetical protein
VQLRDQAHGGQGVDASEAAQGAHHAGIADILADLLDLSVEGKLTIFDIKLVHTLICWILSACVLYALFSGVLDLITTWTRVAVGLVIVEGVVLAASGWTCPLTLLAERRGAARGSVTDIFLPKWFADRIFPLCGTTYVVALVRGAHAAIGTRVREYAAGAGCGSRSRLEDDVRRSAKAEEVGAMDELPPLGVGDPRVIVCEPFDYSLLRLAEEQCVLVVLARFGMRVPVPDECRARSVGAWGRRSAPREALGRRPGSRSARGPARREPGG